MAEHANRVETVWRGMGPLPGDFLPKCKCGWQFPNTVKGRALADELYGDHKWEMQEVKGEGKLLEKHGFTGEMTNPDAFGEVVDRVAAFRDEAEGGED